MLESLEEALDPTLQFCDVCQLLRVWMSKNGKGTWDMAAHLRNRRTPPTWVTCGELGVTAPEQWGALGSALPPCSHGDFLPGLMA